MANRFIGGVLSSRPQANTPFSSRASTGTYFDSAGVMRTAPVNQPRLNYSLVGGAWTQPTVLIEPASTNALLYSQDFSNANWELSSQNSVLTANSITAPDGTVTASTISNNSSNGMHRFYQPLNSFTQRTSYSFSVFLKYKDHQYVSIGLTDNSYYRSQIVVNLVAGTIAQNYIDAYSPSDTLSSTITSVGNGWYRLTGVYTPAIAIISNLFWLGLLQQNSTFSSGGYVGTGTGFYIWGAQAEINSLGATSYIPTTSAAVTRAADVVGPGTSGIFGLEDRQNTTSNDDQSTVQSFTSTGSTTWTAPADVTSVEVLVVAGGGSGGGGSGAIGGGGGGAGGIIYNTSYPVTPGTTYPVIVGAGGVGALRNIGTNGVNSQFGALVARGGGAGASDSNISNVGTPGGSGGGGGGRSGIGAPGTAGQGYSGSNGATNAYYAGGGGGGAGGLATPFIGSVAGAGGPGLYFNISGTSTAYGGGGGGGGSSYSSVSTAGSGGVGGGGGGTSTSINGTAGTANTGGGGGASGWSVDGTNIYGGNGGSGIVIVKYKRTPRQISSTSNAALVVQKFTVNNTWTVPAGVTQVEALVVAGGGGGGAPGGSGGGAGGLQYYSTYPVTPGGSCSVVIGAGGVGGVYNTSPGGRGGSSMFATSAANIVTNGSFDTDTGWVHTLTSIANGYMYLNAGSQPRPTNVSLGSATGSYLLTWTIVSNPGGHSANIDDDGVGAGVGSVTTYVSGISAVGTYSLVVSKTASTRLRIIGSGTFTSSMVFDNVFMYPVSSIISTTGGGGGGGNGASAVDANGGSGAGAAPSYVGGSAGTGIAGQGFAGGASGNIGYGGGGGAGGAGTDGNNVVGGGNGGNGGPGLPFNITGNLEYYAGGGGGGVYTPTGTLPGYGGIGGGGSGTITNAPNNAGAANTGGGGGGVGGGTGAGGAGGSGVVVLRYRVPQVVTFLDSGAWTCPSGVTSVQALIVGGGGGGGSTSNNYVGGSGGGGVVYSSSVAVTPGTTYSVVVGQGGFAVGSVNLPWSSTTPGGQGQNSSFAGIVAFGGGGAGASSSTANTASNGQPGGSGGGGTGLAGGSGGAGTYGQGNAGGASGGGSGTGGAGGGGGGAGQAGAAGSGTTGGGGGNGLAYSISGTATYYGGGGGGSGGGGLGVGGLGGGATANITNGGPAPNGTPNTGGGAGGKNYDPSGQGGSGIVILRWVGA